MNSEVFYSLESDIDKIKTRTVERLIAPLVHLVSLFLDCFSKQTCKKFKVTSLHADYCSQGKSNQNSTEVLLRVKETLEHFINTGNAIIHNHPKAIGKALDQLISALTKVKNTGNRLFFSGILLSFKAMS